jgi:mRNA-decapping enzyme subunit 2
MVPTPAVETTIPLPSIPGEQAGTLLSILTGATPAPQQPAQAPPPLAPRAAASPKVEFRAPPAAPYEQPVAKPQAAPRTPRVTHTAQQAALLATLRGDSPRAASVASGQAFAPPPQVIHAPTSRSSTVGPQAQYRASPGVARQTSQYAPPPNNIDRRDSISSQQQTLLAMFTGGVPPAPEPVLPNPEQAYFNPNPASGGRSRSASRGRAARKEKSEPLKSPLGTERQGLLAYLEGVAKMGGQ